MGPALAATEEGTLIEEAGGKHEDARVAAVVSQQCGSMRCGSTLEHFVAGKEPFNKRSAESIFPSYFVVDCYLWTNL